MFLDARGRRDLLALVNVLEATKLVASHDLELVLQTCARVLLLDHGRLRADGPARAVLADARLMDEHGLEVPHSLRS
jgi:cobalt/nickel transport system ATP-binding protein